MHQRVRSSARLEGNARLPAISISISDTASATHVQPEFSLDNRRIALYNQRVQVPVCYEIGVGSVPALFL